jgi:hypothetical protein
MKKDVSGIIGVIFSTIGVILLVVGIFISIKSLDFQKNAVKGTAVIENIDPGNSTRKHYSSGSASVKYTVDGKVYHSRLNEYSSGMYIGQKVEIYYDPNIPSHMQTSNGWIDALEILIVLGSVFSIIGFVQLFVQMKKKNLKQNLLSYGELVYADTEEISKNSHLSVNGENPYRITCKWLDSSSGVCYTYISENFWQLTKAITDAKKIPVYIDRQKPRKKYYVALDEITEQMNV